MRSLILLTLLALIILAIAGCTSTPRADVKPSKSGIRTDRQESPSSTTRKTRTLVRINMPDAPKPETKR